MANTLEARKLQIRDLLAEIEDETLILQIEALLKPRKDFWEDLTEAQKASAYRGLEQIKRGESISLVDYLAKRKRNQPM